MKTSTIKFVGYVIALTIMCAVLQVALDKQTYGAMKLKSGFLLLGIFAVVITVIHLVLMNSAKASPQTFVRSFMGATVAKFLIFLSVLIGFLAFSGEDKRALVLHFLFFYLVFTILEVAMLTSGLRKTQ